MVTPTVKAIDVAVCSTGKVYAATLGMNVILAAPTAMLVIMNTMTCSNLNIRGLAATVPNIDIASNTAIVEL